MYVYVYVRLSVCVCLSLMLLGVWIPVGHGRRAASGVVTVVLQQQDKLDNTIITAVAAVLV